MDATKAVQAVLKRVGKTTRDVRKERGLTLEQVEAKTLAHGHRLDHSQLSRIEGGKVKTSLDGYVALSCALRIPLWALFAPPAIRDLVNRIRNREA